MKRALKLIFCWLALVSMSARVYPAPPAPVEPADWNASVLKAILINTADSWRRGLDAADADSTRAGGQGWSENHGWGYPDLWHAHFHRDDFFIGQVTPRAQAGHFRLYKGYAFRGDRATLVWQRADLDQASPGDVSFRTLSDLDLRLYEVASNALLDSDTAVHANVHQVEAPTAAAVVVKVFAASDRFDDAATETFVLATEENFSRATGPLLDVTLTAPHRVARSASFFLQAQLHNVGDLHAHDARVRLQLPAGFRLLQGDAEVALGVLADGAIKTLRWQIQAPDQAPLPNAATLLVVQIQSHSYGESFQGDSRHRLTLD